MKFVHLHLHTEYSLLDGANRIGILPARVRELGMHAVAMTDHGVMYGAVDFYESCIREGIKPILGCEVYVAPNGRFSRELPDDKRPYHLILLAENNTGLMNLNRLVSAAFTEGFYYRPRIDMELLEAHHEGLICLSGCLSSQVSRSFTAGDRQAAKATALRYQEIFGQGNYFLEIQSNGIPEQKLVNREIIELARETGIGLVATNDCHYTYKEDARAHEILLCMQTGKRLSDPDRMRMGSEEFYVKSPEEMAEAFRDVPDALENTVRIADRCQVDFDFDTLHLPSYDVPEGESPRSYLLRLCREGLEERLAIRQAYPLEDYLERLEYELDIIDRMGFNDYYLIVWDFISYAKKQGIMVGPGRGSGAASLAAYTLGITSLDPLEYQLLFERFLNPERVSMPDFDIDFCYERRGEVIDYVTAKYGTDHVAQVITFGTLAARQAVRDTARALDLSYPDTDRIAKLIPTALGMTLDRALEESPDLRQAYDNEAVVHEVLDYARKFEGMPRHASTHAAGVVISREPLTDLAPLSRNDDNIVVQYAKGNIEKIGLLKFDFLGLRTLTVLRDTRDMVYARTGEMIDFDKVMMDDPEVFRMISRGDTQAIFQLESPGMTSFMRELKPESLEDIIAGVALFRPGPMEQIPRYVASRHDHTKVHYDHPLLEPILDVTYGCIVYQEQVMQIVRDLGGFSMGQADNVRRAMSKKQPAVLARYKNIFIHGGVVDGGQAVDGCVRRGVPLETAGKIWNEVMAFAGYAFNKAHAACYAVVAYHTAWLKIHHPVPFMAAMLNSFLGNLGQAAHYVRVCQDMNVGILPPDINRSQVRFTAEEGQIRFALGAVKNVGTGVLQDLIQERDANGPFRTFGDFLRRVSRMGMNRKMIESLIKSSAMDGFGIPRNKLLAAVDPYLNILGSQKEVMEGQLSLFDFGLPKQAPVEPSYPDLPDLGKGQLLTMEQEMLGLYVSGHPLDSYRGVLGRLSDLGSSELKGGPPDESLLADGLSRPGAGEDLNGRSAVMGGLVVQRKNLTTRKGEMMSFLELEDLEGRFEVIVFPKTLTMYRDLIREGQVLLVSGRVSAREDEEAKLLADKLAILPDDREWSEGHRIEPFGNARNGYSGAGGTGYGGNRSGRSPAGPAPAERSPQRLSGAPGTELTSGSPAQAPYAWPDEAPPETGYQDTRYNEFGTDSDLPEDEPDDSARSPESLLAEGMLLEIRYPGETGDRGWQALIQALEYFEGDTPARIMPRRSQAEYQEAVREFRVNPCNSLLLALASRCGPDGMKFIPLEEASAMPVTADFEVE